MGFFGRLGKRLEEKAKEIAGKVRDTVRDVAFSNPAGNWLNANIKYAPKPAFALAGATIPISYSNFSAVVETPVSIREQTKENDAYEIVRWLDLDSVNYKEKIKELAQLVIHGEEVKNLERAIKKLESFTNDIIDLHIRKGYDSEEDIEIRRALISLESITRERMNHDEIMRGDDGDMLSYTNVSFLSYMENERIPYAKEMNEKLPKVDKIDNVLGTKYGTFHASSLRKFGIEV